MHYKTLIYLVSLVILFSGCSDANSDGDNPLTSSPKAGEFNNQNNEFGLNLFKQLNGTRRGNENVVLSPVSVSMALGLTYNGTAGETRSRLNRILGWGEMTVPEINEYQKRLIQYYNNHTENISLTIANSIWYNDQLNIYPEFLRNSNEYFAAYHSSYNSESTPAEINAWASRKTEGNIENIVEDFSPENMLYLMNVTYFKGNWKYEFNEEKTAESYFFKDDGTREKTRMMWQKADLNYYDGKSFQMVELPYNNESFCMYILLPDSTMNLNNLVKSLEVDKWKRYKSALEKKRNINFGMPKFRCEYNVGMKELFAGMGVRGLFSQGGADLSNISDEPLSISEVMHKAAIDVDEKGTEATAATSLAISFTTLVDDNPFNLVVNRPFIFAIEEKQSNSLLFIGKIANP